MLTSDLTSSIWNVVLFEKIRKLSSYLFNGSRISDAVEHLGISQFKIFFILFSHF
jgi:hypothetical protein